MEIEFEKHWFIPFLKFLLQTWLIQNHGWNFLVNLLDVPSLAIWSVEMKFCDCPIDYASFWQNDKICAETHAKIVFYTTVEIYVFKIVKACEFVCHLPFFDPRIVPMARARAAAFGWVIIRCKIFERYLLCSVQNGIMQYVFNVPSNNSGICALWWHGNQILFPYMYRNLQMVRCIAGQRHHDSKRWYQTDGRRGNTACTMQ